jgi:hypothetical protein
MPAWSRKGVKIKLWVLMVALAPLLVACGGEEATEERGEASSPQEEWSTASPERKGELQKEAQTASVFEGEHEDLEMGQTADWRSGFHLRLSDAHLATANPDPQQRKAGHSGDLALVVQAEIWNDGQTPVQFKGSYPCAARDPNGIPLQGESGVPEVFQAPRVFSTPLEPGQERAAPMGFTLPQEGSEMTLKCSLAYATGASNTMLGPEPPAGATATWNVDTSEL